MLIETRHVSAADVRRIHCPAQGFGAEESWRFLPSVAGGCFQLPSVRNGDDQGLKDRVLLWQLQTHTTSTLHLAEASAAHGQIGAAVAIELEGHAFADAAFSSTPAGDVAIHLLFADKSAAQLQLPRPAAAAPGRGGGGGAGASVLDALHPGSLLQLPLGPQLTALGAPSAVAVVNRHLVITGASDTVACVPLGAFETGDATAAAHLTTSTSLLQRLVGSLYQPVQRAGVVAALPAVDSNGRPLLALVHDNATLRLWAAPPAQQLVASHELLPGAAARALAPRAALAAGGVPPGELLVVSQLESPDAPGTATLAACHVRLGDAAGGGDGADGGAALARYSLQLPAVGARLLGAQLRGATLHVLAALPGGETRLMAFGARDGAYLGSGQLLSRGPGAAWGVQQVRGGFRCSGRSFGFVSVSSLAGRQVSTSLASLTPPSKQDLWAATLAAFSPATTAEDSVLSQLLVPGQLCRAALREALLFYGAALGRDQVEAAGCDQLRVSGVGVSFLGRELGVWVGSRCFRRGLILHV
jgi:hypothetical protein